MVTPKHRSLLAASRSDVAPGGTARPRHPKGSRADASEGWDCGRPLGWTQVHRGTQQPRQCCSVHACTTWVGRNHCLRWPRPHRSRQGTMRWRVRRVKA
jgi:hypothetical protein